MMFVSGKGMKEKWNLNGIQTHELYLNLKNEELRKNLTRVNDIQIHDLCCVVKKCSFINSSKESMEGQLGH